MKFNETAKTRAAEVAFGQRIAKRRGATLIDRGKRNPIDFWIAGPEEPPVLVEVKCLNWSSLGLRVVFLPVSKVAFRRGLASPRGVVIGPGVRFEYHVEFGDGIERWVEVPVFPTWPHEVLQPMGKRDYPEDTYLIPMEEMKSWPEPRHE